MIEVQTIDIAVESPQQGCEELLDVWRQPRTKVVVSRLDTVPGDVRGFYESLFPLLGRPAALAEDARQGDRTGQRTGGIWMEIRFDPTIQNAYRHSANAQPLHTDGSYIPSFPNSSFLACVTNAAAGGETVFVDSEDVVEALQSESPDLFKRLTDLQMPHARSGDSRTEPVLTQKSGRWCVNWNYYCVAAERGTEQREVAEAFHQFLLQSPAIAKATVDVKLRPGEAVLWKDYELLHGRRAFSAVDAGERFIWKCAFDVGQTG